MFIFIILFKVYPEFCIIRYNNSIIIIILKLNLLLIKCTIYFQLCGPKLGKTKNLDLIALLSFCVNVLAKYPYETDTVVSKGWRFLDLHVPTFASYVIG